MLVAKKQEYYDLYIPQPEEIEYTQEKQESKTFIKPKKKILSRVFPIFMILVGFATASLIVARYAILSENDQKIIALEKTLEAQQSIQENLKVELASSASLNYIEWVAKVELGMDYPSSNQVQFVEFESAHEKPNTEIHVAKQSEPSFWDKIIQLLD